MPLETWHRPKSSHDKSTSDYLKVATGQYLDWETVTLFYSSLHMIDALLARRNIHPVDHSKRNGYVRTMFKEIRQAYASLYHTARRARYAANVYEIDRDNAMRNYSIIKRFVETKLGYKF